MWTTVRTLATQGSEASTLSFLIKTIEGKCHLSTTGWKNPKFSVMTQAYRKYKTFFKEIKEDPDKLRDRPYSWIGGPNIIIKMSDPVIELMTLPQKWSIFSGNWQAHWRCGKLRWSKRIKGVGGIMQDLWSQTQDFLQNSAVKTVWFSAGTDK